MSIGCQNELMTKTFTAGSEQQVDGGLRTSPQAPIGSCFGTTGSAEDVTESVELNGKTAIVVAD